MKKVPWGEIALGAVVGFWVTIIIVKLLGLFGGLLGKLTADNIINLIGVVASLGAIYAVFKSTEKQIKNQNKENHRPYVTVSEINKISDNFSNDSKEEKMSTEDFHYGNMIATERATRKFKKEGLKYNDKIVNFDFHIKNIGYGIACSLNFISIKEDDSCWKSKDGAEEGDVFSAIDIEMNGSKKLNFNICVDFDIDDSKEKTIIHADNAHVLMFYNDLYGNCYSTLISIVVSESGKLNYACYPNNTDDFREVMNIVGCDYNKKVKEYRESIGIK